MHGKKDEPVPAGQSTVASNYAYAFAGCAVGKLLSAMGCER